jgi:hypothetical protein
MAARTIQMIPRNPESVPRAKAEKAAARGIPKARQETRKAASTPQNAAWGAAMPRCLTPSLSRCGWRAMKYSRTTIGIAATIVERMTLPVGL